MYFKCDFSDYRPWSGAVETYEKIERAGKLDELESLLEEIFCDDIPTETAINDLLWFDWEWVLESLGMKEEEEEEEEEDD